TSWEARRRWLVTAQRACHFCVPTTQSHPRATRLQAGQLESLSGCRNLALRRERSATFRREPESIAQPSQTSQHLCPKASETLEARWDDPKAPGLAGTRYSPLQIHG